MTARARTMPRKQCHCCGRWAARRFRFGAGKAMAAHKCPHGLPCVTGDRLLGMHANHPRCVECARCRRLVDGKYEFSETPFPDAVTADANRNAGITPPLARNIAGPGWQKGKDRAR